MNRKTKPELRISYTPRPDVSPESEAKVLAQVYKYVLNTAKNREKAAGGVAARAARKEKEKARS